MEKLDLEEKMNLIDEKQVVVTAKSNILDPIKCGNCFLDYIQGDYKSNLDRIEDAEIVYNKSLQHIHIFADLKIPQQSENLYIKEFLQNAKTYPISLEHSDLCPARSHRVKCQNANVATTLSTRNVKVAMCMVIFDIEDKIFMTRRASRMNYYPNAWVFPGGHIEIGESLEEGVIREIFEETGIEIETHVDEEGQTHYTYQKTTCQLEPYYAFESVGNKQYTIEDPPNSQHLIIFYRIKLLYPSHSIRLNLQTKEVGGAVWLSRLEIDKIFSKVEGKIEGFIPNDAEEDVTQTAFDLSQLFPGYPNERSEGISKAHNLAIKQLLKSYYKKGDLE